MASAPLSPTYVDRRASLEAYFDRTARQAWERLTSDAPISGIRATVRAGRERMRDTLLSWLPGDLTGRRVLDAGCGTGAFAIEAARRGADVVAVDIAAGLVDVARERTPAGLAIDWRVGDFADTLLGRFDHVVAMDSLIHYSTTDIIAVVRGLARRTNRSLLFTFAPHTPSLAAMHMVGRLFPQGNRAPAIQPVREEALRARLVPLRVGRSERIVGGFYISQAMEVPLA